MSAPLWPVVRSGRQQGATRICVTARGPFYDSSKQPPCVCAGCRCCREPVRPWCMPCAVHRRCVVLLSTAGKEYHMMMRGATGRLIKSNYSAMRYRRSVLLGASTGGEGSAQRGAAHTEGRNRPNSGGRREEPKIRAHRAPLSSADVALAGWLAVQVTASRNTCRGVGQEPKAEALGLDGKFKSRPMRAFDSFK
jgi:hypothetical protein